MHAYDLLVKNADIATVGDRYRADIAIAGGRIVAIGRSPRSKRAIHCKPRSTTTTAKPTAAR